MWASVSRATFFESVLHPKALRYNYHQPLGASHHLEFPPSWRTKSVVSLEPIMAIHDETSRWKTCHASHCIVKLYEVYFKIRWRSGYILDLHIGDIHEIWTLQHDTKGEKSRTESTLYMILRKCLPNVWQKVGPKQTKQFQMLIYGIDFLLPKIVWPQTIQFLRSVWMGHNLPNPCMSPRPVFRIPGAPRNQESATLTQSTPIRQAELMQSSKRCIIFTCTTYWNYIQNKHIIIYI